VSKQRQPPRRRLFVDTSVIDVKLPVPDAVLVHHETLHQLRTLPWVDAAKLLSQIILAAEHDGAIPESREEKRIRTAHERVCKAEENPSEHKDDTASRRYRRDRKTLGFDPRPIGVPRRNGQK
jgi:hypothetical protein